MRLKYIRVPRACLECGEPFLPWHKTGKYCSQTCSNRVVNRLQRARMQALGAIPFSNQDWRRNLKRAAIAAYGGKCVCCGEEHIEFLQLDHKDNNGAQHRRDLGVPGGVGFYAYLRKHGWPDFGLQVLCGNCNFSFGAYGYCPHGTLPNRVAARGRKIPVNSGTKL